MNMFNDIPLPGRKKFHIALFIFPLINILIQSNIPTAPREDELTHTRKKNERVILASAHYRHPTIPKKKKVKEVKKETQAKPKQKAMKKSVAKKATVQKTAPKNNADNAQTSVKVSLTAYCSHPSQTDGNPYVTASGKRVAPEIISTNFLPFGTKVKFPDLAGFSDKTFVVGDRMNKRYWHVVDLWMPTCAQAKQFGRKSATLVVVK